MTNKLFFSIAFAVVFAVVLLFMITTKHQPKVIGWIPYWDQDNASQSFRKNVSKIDYISVFWYRIDENGNLGAYGEAVEDKSLIDFAKQNNVKILALVANLSETDQGEWDHKRVNKVIESGASRKKHIEDLIQLVEKNNFDGIDIDYEALKVSQRENFTLFIEELSGELHKRNRILGIAIHPKTSEDNPLEDNGSHAQDLRKIGRYADQLYLMTYLEHGAFSEPGPIGSLPWMEQVLHYGLAQVPRQKVYLGIGLMGARWVQENGGEFKGQDEETTFLDVYRTAGDHNIVPIWDDLSKTPYLEFKTDAGNNIVWFENAESIRLRINLARKLKVGGIAFWRLGGEDERIWKEIK